MSKQTPKLGPDGKPVAGPAGQAYVLSGSPTAAASAGQHVPLLLLLSRSLSIKQKASDIDIHATFTLLKRAKAILEHAVQQQQQQHAGASAGAASAAAGGSTATSSLAASLAVQGAQFGSEGDNADATRTQNPVRYARAYVAQLVDIVVLVLKGIGSQRV
jgi:hypothetical protein